MGWWVPFPISLLFLSSPSYLFKDPYHYIGDFLGGLDGKQSTCNAGDLGLEYPLEKGTVTYSNILAWRIPWRSLVGYSPLGHKE